MFENIDELIEVNLKLLYASKSQFMMRINFKDEYGFNLKNSKGFAEILVMKGLVVLECDQGFRCDLTDFGKQIYVNGGWNKYLETVQPFENCNAIENIDSQVKKSKRSPIMKIMFVGITILLLSFFLILIILEMTKNS
ncbi:hypothetical protein [Flavobacterium sp. WC2509]|uniref:hypothetical protein n=1 Tax=Flavobacterium sp. WC2509 TaxID=3461406 RepID=UPI004043A123